MVVMDTRCDDLEEELRQAREQLRVERDKWNNERRSNDQVSWRVVYINFGFCFLNFFQIKLTVLLHYKMFSSCAIFLFYFSWP